MGFIADDIRINQFRDRSPVIIWAPKTPQVHFVDICLSSIDKIIIDTLEKKDRCLLDAAGYTGRVVKELTKKADV